MSATINMAAARLRVSDALGCDAPTAGAWLYARFTDGTVPQLEGLQPVNIARATMLRAAHQCALRLHVDDLEAALARELGSRPMTPKAVVIGDGKPDAAIPTRLAIKQVRADLDVDEAEAMRWLTARRRDRTVPHIDLQELADSKNREREHGERVYTVAGLADWCGFNSGGFVVLQSALRAALDRHARPSPEMSAARRPGPTPSVTDADVAAVMESESEPKARAHALAERCHVDVSTARKWIKKWLARQAR